MEDLAITNGDSSLSPASIRTIVREEIERVLTDKEGNQQLKLIMPELGLMPIPNLEDQDKAKPAYTLDVSIDAIEEDPSQPRETAPLSVVAQLEYEGKIYEGVLYFVRDVDKD